MIKSIIYAAYSLVLVNPNPNINFIQNIILLSSYHYYYAIYEYIAQDIYVQQKLCYAVFYHCVKPLCFSFGFNLKVHIFKIPQEMSTFVDLTKYFDLRPKHQGPVSI